MSANDEKTYWNTVAKLMIVIAVVLAILWWRSENERIKRIEELKTQIEEQNEEIDELKSTIKYLEEELE